METLKRVLLLVPRLNIGGAETYVATVAKQLHAQGYTVYIASGGGILAESLVQMGMRHFFLPIRLSVHLSAYILNRIIKKYHIQLIHSNSAAAGIVAVLVKQKYIPIPVIYTAHGVFGHNRKEMLLNQCDRIICVSEFVRMDAIRKGFDAERLVTMYSGVDLNKFHSDPLRKIKLLHDYRISQDKFVIAIVSRIKNLQDKGHLDLLKILTQYPNAQNWHLIVIGKGTGLRKLKYYIRKNHLESRVHCAGHVLEVQNILDIADIVVLPSKFETFGLVLAEGMAMEKPVTAYSVGGTPEVIDDRNTGFLVEPNNIDDLYYKINLLAQDKVLCTNMGKRGRQWVAENFSDEKMIKNIITIYECFIGTRF